MKMASVIRDNYSNSNNQIHKSHEIKRGITQINRGKAEKIHHEARRLTRFPLGESDASVLWIPNSVPASIRFESFEPIRIALVWLKLRWVLCFINFHGNGTYIPIYIYIVKTYIHSE